MYVKFPGGWRNPGGYVVPCEVIKAIGKGWTLIELSSVDGETKWNQAVRNSQLISDDEAERA